VWRDDGDAPVTLTVSELDLVLDGSTRWRVWHSPRRR
jgi:hypothetical protein